MVLYLALGLSFLLYHVVLFDFSEKLYASKPNKFLTRLITFAINIVILTICYVFRPHDAIIMIIFVAAVYIEFAVIYKEKAVKNLFAGISFALNLFAMRLLVKCILALINNVHLYYITENLNLDVISTTVALLFCSLYIKVLVANTSDKNANIMCSNKGNLTQSAFVLAFIYLFLIFNTTNLYTLEIYPLFLPLQIKIAISAVIGYFAAIIFAFLHSKSMLYKTQTHEMQDKVYLQEKENQRLRYIAYRDESVECYNRTFGMDTLEENLKDNTSSFSIVFFDIDGLKAVNDNFGHSEGDVYIKSVANILNNTFNHYNLCRMGGDEFMIIMPQCDNFNAQRFCIQAYEAVEMLCKMSNQKYHMSISYGILEVSAKQRYSITEILEIVDKRMYDFKRANKGVRIH